MRHQRAFTLIELLVVIAIISVLALILVPNILSAVVGSRQTVDATNLSRLVETYLKGQTSAKPKKNPTAVGQKFWLALVVGDGVGQGGLEIQGDDDPDKYLGVGDAVGLLVSPADSDAMDKTDIQKALEDAVANGSGVNGLPNPDKMCSYAGPTQGRKVMTDDKAPYCGCTADRDNVSLFKDGFNAVRNNKSTEFLYYRDMVDKHGWADTGIPQYGRKPLDNVQK